MQKSTILCVDDEVDNVDALERLFRRKYHVLRAHSGPEALQVLDQYPGEVATVITDQKMPSMTGVEFLEKTLDQRPDMVRLLLTGYTDLESVIGAVNKGQIYRYLTKPWDPVDLANTVDRAVERYLMGQELKRKNIELAAAYEELKSLDTAKSNFMILINHELKTPLTGILNFTALLRESALDDEQRLYVDRIQKSGDRLQTLIDDVLVVVKAETDQLKSDLVATDLPPSTDVLTPDLRNLLIQKNMQIVDVGPRRRVRADIGQIRQILLRLIHNAIKFGDPGSSIEVRTEPGENSQKISVHNKGAPISEAVIDKIFRPFFIDENIMNHSSGIGMGLTICQALLALHGTGLNIRNAEDGVTVGFELPLERPSDPSVPRT